MSRVPLTRVAAAAFKTAQHSLTDTLKTPTRKLSLQVKRPMPFSDVKSKLIFGEKATGLALLGGDFNFAGQTLNVGADDPWDRAAPSERFARWLHGFHWFEDLITLKEPSAAIKARFLVDRWIDVYGGHNPFAWELSTLTSRLYAWLSMWSPALNADSSGEIASLRRTSALRQMKYLRTHYTRTEPGFPRFMAALTLALGGGRLADKAESYLDRGLDWLDDEIEIQILPDGGHISRSPETAFKALNALMVLDEILEARGISRSKSMGRAIDRLQPIIPFFTHTDGTLACFNGGGEGQKKRIEKILKAAELTSRPFGYSPHTGYQRLAHGGTVIIADTGRTTAAPYDKEAHLAPLAFELSTQAGRMIVNCGWSGEQPANWRSAVRATAAHSSLTLGETSAGKLLDEGFRARLLGDVIEKGIDDVTAKRKEQVTGVWLETSHGGYRAKTGLMHRRRLYITQDGEDIRGEDSLYLPVGAEALRRDAIAFDIRFHLHPSCRATLAQDQKSALIIQDGRVGWRMRTDGGPLSVEPSFYLGTGSTPQKTSQIVIRGKAFADGDGETQSNRVRWSLRLLEARRR